MVQSIIEIRAEGEQLRGVIITEGRASSDRAEVFAPGSVTWPSTGIEIKDGHDGPTLATAFPVRDAGGEIRIRATATAAIRAAIEAGKNKMSVEFHALKESRKGSGAIREITSAMISAAALVADPSYVETSAEVRSRGRSQAWWR